MSGYWDGYEAGKRAERDSSLTFGDFMGFVGFMFFVWIMIKLLIGTGMLEERQRWESKYGPADKALSVIVKGDAAQ